jgi:hypothetical protein
MVLCVIKVRKRGRCRSAITLLTFLAVLLASGPWCSAQADHLHHSDTHLSVQGLAEPAPDHPAEDSDSHCAAAASVDTAVRAQAGDTAGPMAAAAPQAGLIAPALPVSAIQPRSTAQVQLSPMQLLCQLRI